MPAIDATGLSDATRSTGYRGGVAAILVATAVMLCGVRGAGVAAETEEAAAAAQATAEPEAVAWLRVRKLDSESEAQYERYRRTQQHLIKRPAVLVSALRLPGISNLESLREEKDQVAWLTRHIQVVAPAESDVMQIRMRGENPREAQQIVNAVAQAYISDVVNKERTERLARREALERQYKTARAEVRRRLHEFNELARSLGTQDSPEVGMQKTLLLDRLRSLQEQITRLEIDRLAVEADLVVAMKIGEKPDSKVAARREVLGEQIATLREQGARIAKELEALGNANADLDVRRNDIQQLQEVNKQMAIALNACEVDMVMPPRVELIEEASVSAGLETQDSSR